MPKTPKIHKLISVLNDYEIKFIKKRIKILRPSLQRYLLYLMSIKNKTIPSINKHELNFAKKHGITIHTIKLLRKEAFEFLKSELHHMYFGSRKWFNIITNYHLGYIFGTRNIANIFIEEIPDHWKNFNLWNNLLSVWQAEITIFDIFLKPHEYYNVNIYKKSQELTSSLMMDLFISYARTIRIITFGQLHFDHETIPVNIFNNQLKLANKILENSNEQISVKKIHFITVFAEILNSIRFYHSANKIINNVIPFIYNNLEKVSSCYGCEILFPRLLSLLYLNSTTTLSDLTPKNKKILLKIIKYTLENHNKLIHEEHPLLKNTWLITLLRMSYWTIHSGFVEEYKSIYTLLTGKYEYDKYNLTSNFTNFILYVIENSEENIIFSFHNVINSINELELKSYQPLIYILEFVSKIETGNIEGLKYTTDNFYNWSLRHKKLSEISKLLRKMSYNLPNKKEWKKWTNELEKIYYENPFNTTIEWYFPLLKWLKSKAHNTTFLQQIQNPYNISTEKIEKTSSTLLDVENVKIPGSLMLPE